MVAKYCCYQHQQVPENTTPAKSGMASSWRSPHCEALEQDSWECPQRKIPLKPDTQHRLMHVIALSWSLGRCFCSLNMGNPFARSSGFYQPSILFVLIFQECKEHQSSRQSRKNPQGSPIHTCLSVIVCNPSRWLCKFCLTVQTVSCQQTFPPLYR